MSRVFLDVKEKKNEMKDTLNFYLSQLDRVEEDAANLNMSVDEVLEHIKKSLIKDLQK